MLTRKMKTFATGLPVSEGTTVGEPPLVTFALTVIIPEGEFVLGENTEKGGHMVENVIFGDSRCRA